MKRDPARQREKGPLSHTEDRFPGTSRKRCDTVVLHDSSPEGPEVIRLSQWAEIRQMHVVDGVPKKQIAERLGLDIKTVRRAVAQATAPARRAVSRPRHLDRWRAQIEQWLRSVCTRSRPVSTCLTAIVVLSSTTRSVTPPL